MARRPLLRDSRFPYHVTARSNNCEWFYLTVEDSWMVFSRVLAVASERLKVEIHAFVLMSNHYHLLISTPQKNLDQFMRYLMTEVSREIGKRSGRINHVFGSRYKWSWLPDPYAVAYLFKYIYRNPVKAGLAKSCEQYRYSTANVEALSVEKKRHQPLGAAHDLMI